MKKKVGRPSKKSKSKLKDASTQTERYVEHMPLPILVDIKSENDMSDENTYNQGIEVFESLKVELDDTNHFVGNCQPESEPLTLGQEPQLPLQIEQLYFEEKINVETLQFFLPSDKNRLQKSTKNSSRKRKQQLQVTTNGTAAKKSKRDKSNQKKSPKERKKCQKSKSHGKTSSANPLKPVECILCKFTCKSPSQLKRHMTKHSGERPHHCIHCPKRFAQKNDLNRHMSSHALHYDHHCGSCGRGFADDNERLQHQTNCKTKRYSCEQCIYQTFSIGNLQLHMRKHTGERPFACDVCDRRFTRVSHLNQHVKLHAEDFDLHCKKCGRGFFDENAMIKHQISCRNRQFQCHMCHDVHLRMDNLKRHIKTIHMGWKRWKEIMCEYCSKQFPAKSSLTKHIRKRHKDRVQE